MKRLHISPELYKEIENRAKKWDWLNTSRYLEYELRRMFKMPPEEGTVLKASKEIQNENT